MTAEGQHGGGASGISIAAAPTGEERELGEGRGEMRKEAAEEEVGWHGGAGLPCRPAAWNKSSFAGVEATAATGAGQRRNRD